MVARIKIGKSIKGILNYNELKVREGKADLILASGFSTDAEDLTFSQKLRRFEKLIQRNDRIKTNAVHVSLNYSLFLLAISSIQLYTIMAQIFHVFLNAPLAFEL